MGFSFNFFNAEESEIKKFFYLINSIIFIGLFCLFDFIISLYFANYICILTIVLYIN